MEHRENPYRHRVMTSSKLQERLAAFDVDYIEAGWPGSQSQGCRIL